MPDKKQPGDPFEIKSPEKHLEINPLADPEKQFIPEKDPDFIPDETLVKVSPLEGPPPGEGP